MKINVTVDLEDFYNEDDSSFNEQILDDIQRRVEHEVWGMFTNTALTEFKTKITKDMEGSKDEEVSRIVNKVFTEKKIKVKEPSKGNPEPETVTLYEYIEDTITKGYFHPDRNADYLLRDKLHEFQVKFEEALSKTSKGIADELINRYDLLFASQIVNNLSKAGMLKDDVAKLLIENKQ